MKPVSLPIVSLTLPLKPNPSARHSTSLQHDGRPRFGDELDATIGFTMLGGIGVATLLSVFHQSTLQKESRTLLEEYQALSPEAMLPKLKILNNIFSKNNPYALGWGIKAMVSLPVPERYKIFAVLPLLRHRNMAVRNWAHSAAQFMAADNRVHPKVQDTLKELLLEVPVVTDISSKGHVSYSGFSEVYNDLEAKLIQIVSRPLPKQSQKQSQVTAQLYKPTIMINPRMVFRPNYNIHFHQA